MAKVGMLHPKYSIITVGTDASSGAETETYGEVTSMGKAVRANVSINVADTKLYADDSVAEIANEFIEGTITAETDDMEDSVAADLIGCTVEESGGTVTYKDTDKGKYVRHGFVVRRQKKNVQQYKAIVYCKVLFDIPNDDFETKGETISFKTNTITGKILKNVRGEWKIAGAWKDTLEKADTELAALLKPTGN